MTDSVVPDKDHVARYCKPSKVDEDGGISPSAFLLRDNEEYLSVYWLEKGEGENAEEQVSFVRHLMENKRHYHLRRNGRFAVLNVGQTREKVAEETNDHRKLEVKHKPKFREDSHAGVFNTNHSDAELMIATLIVASIKRVHDAKPSEQ